jgi:hypothetical protein
VSGKRGLVPAELTARYTELKAKLSAAIEAKPLDWAGCADAEEQLDAVCREISVALHRANEHELASIVSDAGYSYCCSARESRKQATKRAERVL